MNDNVSYSRFFLMILIGCLLTIAVVLVGTRNEDTHKVKEHQVIIFPHPENAS